VSPHGTRKRLHHFEVGGRDGGVLHRTRQRGTSRLAAAPLNGGLARMRIRASGGVDANWTGDRSRSCCALQNDSGPTAGSAVGEQYATPRASDRPSSLRRSRTRGTARLPGVGTSFETRPRSCWHDAASTAILPQVPDGTDDDRYFVTHANATNTTALTAATPQIHIASSLSPSYYLISRYGTCQRPFKDRSRRLTAKPCLDGQEEIVTLVDVLRPALVQPARRELALARLAVTLATSRKLGVPSLR
jgi:hypothetical protein